LIGGLSDDVLNQIGLAAASNIALRLVPGARLVHAPVTETLPETMNLALNHRRTKENPGARPGLVRYQASGLRFGVKIPTS